LCGYNLICSYVKDFKSGVAAGLIRNTIDLGVGMAKPRPQM